jgi:hypothetical protein
MARLCCSARVLLQLLGASANQQLVAVAQQMGLDCTRQKLVDALAQPLAAVAALTHQLVRGIRLM